MTKMLNNCCVAMAQLWRNLINTWLQPGEVEPKNSRNCFNSFLLPAVTQAFRLVGAAFVVMGCLIFPARLQADGGVVRARETQGPFVVTLFSPAEVAANLPTDLTVMVQRGGTGEVVMDATVDVSLVPPSGAKIRPGDPFCSSADGGSSSEMAVAGSSATFRATRAQAANKLLYGLAVILRAPGDWQLCASVRHGGQSEVLRCTLPVGMPVSRSSGLWFCLALPPCIIALFVLNQWLRRQSAASAALRAAPARTWLGKKGVQIGRIAR